VDKFPIFLSETGPTEPRARANFCFVDEGSATLSGFETYISQYAALWLLLKDFEVIYVADTKRLYPAAERRFAAFLNQLKSSDYDPDARLAKRVIEHFEARFLYEKGDLGSFSRDKLIRLRNERAEFSEPKHRGLYQCWKTGGAQAVLHAIAPYVRVPFSCNATFSTCLVEQSYEFLGKNQRPE